MNTKVVTVLISGAGQLGSRYLQGLAHCRLPLQIHVQDNHEASLDRAKQRWHEVLGQESHHEVSFHTSLDRLPWQIDIAIVATAADVRPQVVGEIASRSTVRYWVLEKILAQSKSGLDEITLSVKGCSGAWVNTPRRMMPWHHQIKSKLGLDKPMTLKVEGGLWGLACNAVHFLDLFAWWTGETFCEIRIDHLDQNWFESKRQGFWEVTGTLEARFSGGSLALLSAREDGGAISMVVNDAHKAWQINETEGVARCTDGIEIPGRLTFQSELSAALVESILERGSCDLPTLDESVAIHRIFVGAMLAHWRQAGNPAATFVPIT